jgi:hypothetical protein
MLRAANDVRPVIAESWVLSWQDSIFFILKSRFHSPAGGLVGLLGSYPRRGTASRIRLKLSSDSGEAPRKRSLLVTEAQATGLVVVAAEGQVEQVMIVIIAEEEIQRMKSQ